LVPCRVADDRRIVAAEALRDDPAAAAERALARLADATRVIVHPDVEVVESHPAVDVAVVAFNARDTLPRLLACLRASGAPDDRITIYDMASTDDLGAWLATEWPRVRVVRLPINNGPDPGRNLALRSATRPYLLLLDADAYVRPDVPARLRAALDPARKVGTTVPVVVHTNAPETIQYAGGSMHFICEAINPFLDRPLAERGADPLTCRGGGEGGYYRSGWKSVPGSDPPTRRVPALRDRRPYSQRVRTWRSGFA
jgi:glycosyltransferase involved in cell wall biosynthesis